jgi:uncharacterized protein with GYD domain
LDRSRKGETRECGFPCLPLFAPEPTHGATATRRALPPTKRTAVRQDRHKNRLLPREALAPGEDVLLGAQVQDADGLRRRVEADRRHATEAYRVQVESAPSTRKERALMPTYIMLTTLTPDGVQTIKNNPARIREVNREVEQLGATVKAQWATLGQFDFVNVIEAPDEQTIARVSLELGSRGTGRYETLTAIPIDDFIGLI